MEDPDHVLGFWFDELEEKDWYVGGDALDARIRNRFADLWQQARAGRLDGWETSPRNVLAYLILTDQFPRNMWRGHADSFATDAVARTAAKRAIDLGWDTRIEGAGRQFFYTPLMHSECLVDQDRCVRLIATRMPGSDGNLLHAKAHREVIRRFGRFPYRNAALGRDSRAEELTYIEDGGYGSTVEALKAAA
jgi:uncharacterized protein (DUF924 family)